MLARIPRIPFVRPDRIALLTVMLGTFMLGIFGAAVHAQEASDSTLSTLIQTAEDLARHPVIVQAAELQNEQGEGQKKVKLQQQNHAGGEVTAQGMKLQSNDAGQLFQDVLNKNQEISTISLTDKEGAHVATHPATANELKGDEEMWLDPYSEGKDKLYIGPLNYDEMTNNISTQIAVPVIKNQESIGVILMGVKVRPGNVGGGQ